MKLLAAYSAAVVLFWAIRLYYWHRIDEPPFSDIADYVTLASCVAKNFDFCPGFWQSYKLPGLPIFMGTVFFVSGGPKVDVFRAVQTVLLFGSVLWVLRELYVRTKSHGLIIAALFGVALSQPSVFWSQKVGTESVSEAYVFLVIAAGLHYSRRPSVVSAAVAAAVMTAATLTRANFLPVLPIFGAVVLVRAYFRPPGRSAFLHQGAAFVLTALVIWSPWLVRGYSLYGQPVPLSTQGPYTFLWELGNVTVTNADGTTTTTEVNKLQREATNFPNDLAAAVEAQRYVNAWLASNWRTYPRLWWSRLTRQITSKTIYLTKVSRTNLFGNWLDSVLIDKSPWLVVSGLLGYMILALRVRSDSFVPLGIAGMAAFGAAFLGYPRMFEPLVSALVIGTAVLAWAVLPLFRHSVPRILLRKPSAP